jgi:DNA repair protein RecN (Recombination protein N)
MVVTEVETLDAPARREEIARMLAGATVTNAAREAAESLLEDAAEAANPKPANRARA